MRDVLDGIEVLVLGRDLDGAAPAAGAVEGLATGVRNVGAADVDPVVMKALVQGRVVPTQAPSSPFVRVIPPHSGTRTLWA